ncbi:hypothetical protein ABWH96_05230 [Marivirga tractuosa]|uniref:hypothetical protein n=1 Tax=Marivirga tractuosa TaxID=1006 RepID=UPI0035D050BC
MSHSNEKSKNQELMTEDQYYVGFVSATAISEDMLYVAGAFYNDPIDPITQATRVYVYNPDMEGEWFYHDVEGQVIDLCFMPPMHNKPRVGCALVADANEVEFFNSTEHYFETIHKPQSLRDITINALKFLDGNLYAVGSDAAIFRREKSNQWKLISENIYQPFEMPDYDTDNRIDSINEMADSLINRVEICNLTKTVTGSYWAVGHEGFVAVADSDLQWERIEMPYQEDYLGILEADNGNVWITGSGGVLLYGNKQNGFRDMAGNDNDQCFGPICRYGDDLILGAWEGLFIYTDGIIKRLITHTKLDKGGGTLPIMKVEVVNKTIWVVCDRAIFKYNGKHWQEIKHPDTEPLPNSL